MQRQKRNSAWRTRKPSSTCSISSSKCQTRLSWVVFKHKLASLFHPPPRRHYQQRFKHYSNNCQHLIPYRRRLCLLKSLHTHQKLFRALKKQRTRIAVHLTMVRHIRMLSIAVIRYTMTEEITALPLSLSAKKNITSTTLGYPVFSQKQAQIIMLNQKATRSVTETLNRRTERPPKTENENTKTRK